ARGADRRSEQLRTTAWVANIEFRQPSLDFAAKTVDVLGKAPAVDRAGRGAVVCCLLDSIRVARRGRHRTCVPVGKNSTPAGRCKSPSSRGTTQWSSRQKCAAASAIHGSAAGGRSERRRQGRRKQSYGSRPGS